MKLSVIIITKNAENTIADAISSVEFADETILIDSGSQDLTTEIAERMGAKIYKYTTDNFSEMRNYGLKKAKGNYVFYIDADEQVTEDLADSIKQEIEKNSGKAAYKVKRKNFYYGKYEWPYIEHLERLFIRKKLNGWYGKLHESPLVEGRIGYLDGFLLHYTHQDIASMVEKTNIWSETEAQLRFDAHHPKMVTWRFLRVMMTAFFDSYIKQKGWKAGTVGFIESIYQSYSMFITYAKLWEMQQKQK